MTNAATVKIISRRLKGISYIRFGGLDPLYRRLPAAHRTVTLQVQRGALSEPVAEAMAKELGPDAWAFIVGQSDTLADQPDQTRAA